jgi:hypothetical protein
MNQPEDDQPTGLEGHSVEELAEAMDDACPWISSQLGWEAAARLRVMDQAIKHYEAALERSQQHGGDFLCKKEWNAARQLLNQPEVQS